MGEGTNPKKANKAWYILLLVPFVATLFPSFYASATPTLWGFPFFYWYQMLWVVISAILTAIVYKATK
ncbi:MAG: hypothetical protein A2201_04105 [Alicyclobacillus sp. RIFOXYA1_FULL_53_8]|nr:MAG: hypothetical protein A2201_04105 [Alicyclobacillus sp. RIFOXYA1_FULL_53_8]